MDCEACRRQLDELTGFANTIQLPSSRQSGNPQTDDHASGQRRDSALLGGVLARLANSSRIGLPALEPNVSAKNGPDGVFDSQAAAHRLRSRRLGTIPSPARLDVAAHCGGAAECGRMVGQSVRRNRDARAADQRADHDPRGRRGRPPRLDGQPARHGGVGRRRRAAPAARAGELLALADGTPQARSQLVRAQAQAAIRSRLEEPLRRGEFTGFACYLLPESCLADDDGCTGRRGARRIPPGILRPRDDEGRRPCRSRSSVHCC